MLKKAAFPAFLLMILLVFLLSYFDLRYILLNTTPTGGDTPAHNYLVKQLKETFFTRGAVISYSRGWWCGFPMYQYYFFFPYLVMAAMSFIIPINIAFKIISILGVIFLPLAVYFSMKWMDFDESTTLIAALAMIPFLFVESHTMWGVNIYSTLAGEISNSISFVFFVLFLGAFYKDMEGKQFRLRTVVLFALLFYTHFFTSVIAGVVSVFLLLIFGWKDIRSGLVVFLKTNALTFLLVAWWVVPLLAKSAYSMEFGGDWNVVLWKTFPFYMLGLLPFILYAVFQGFSKRKANIIFIICLLLVCLLAFYTAGKFNASFTNIRFWPFIFYSLVILACIGAGKVLEDFEAKELLIISLVLMIMMTLSFSKNNVRSWVKWNYEGLEKKADYASFRELVYPLNNTPGRLANDLHPYNDHFGSTRVFETVPAIINKDILEGGIVNSAAGSMFSYYIQGEMSKSCAGFPTVVNPTSFNAENGTKHLKLANVKHFIAYWDQTRNALRLHPEWKLLKSRGAYDLFDLTTNDGRYIYIPENRPMAVKTREWKKKSMEWIYTIKAIDNPFILLHEEADGAIPDITPILSEEEYISYLSGFTQSPDEIPVWLNLGPFYFPGGLSDEKAADHEFVKLSELKPEAGAKQSRRVWKPILRRGPVFFDGLYNPKINFVCYNYVRINSEMKQQALLHYSNDDHARIYLNGLPVVSTPITGLNNYQTREVTLRRGGNDLVYKLEQSVGGAFFHARITGLNGQPLPSVSYSITSTPYSVQAEKTKASAAMIKEEVISDQLIKFRTKALYEPHIIKFSYFPNWQVKGAKKVYHVTPNFMLVYPEQEEVALYYGSLPSDIAGRWLTLIGTIIFAGLAVKGIIVGQKR